MTRASPVVLPLLSNLVGLPGGAAKGLGSIGTAGTDYVDIVFSPIWVKTTTVNPAGAIVLCLLVAEEAGRWTDAIDPTVTTSQHTLIGDATRNAAVQVLDGSGPNSIAANTVYVFQGFSVIQILGYRPTFVAPLVWNRLGVGNPLSAVGADFYGKYTILT